MKNIWKTDGQVASCRQAADFRFTIWCLISNGLSNFSLIALNHSDIVYKFILIHDVASLINFLHLRGAYATYVVY